MQSNKNSLLEELYIKYNKLVYSLAFKITSSHDLSEECVQDTFLIVAKKITRFENLEEDHKRNLVCTIARGKAIDSVRREKPIMLTEGIETSETPSFDSFDTTELIELLEKLRPREQTYISLKYVYGFSNKEIAVMYDVSASYIGRVINNSLKTIKKNLEG